MFEEFMDFSFPTDTFQQTSTAQDMMGQFYGPTNQELGYNPQSQGPFTSQFGSLFGPENTSAMSRYKQYLGDFPQYQSPGIGTKILAALAGLSSGIRDPAKGIQTSLGIMNTPYQQEVQRYGMMEAPLRQAASLEEKALNDKVAWMRAQQESQMDRQKFGMEQSKFGLEQQKFGLDQQKFQLDQEQMKADQAYKNGQISNEEYANRTARINAMANQGQSAASAGQSNAMADYYRAKTADPSAFMSQGSDRPNASMVQEQIKAALVSDPLLSEYQGDLEEIMSDPMASARLHSIYQQLGLIPNQDIELP